MPWRGVRREVIEVYAFIGAPSCQQYFLVLCRSVCRRRRQRRESQTSNCRGMGVEEEGIGKRDTCIFLLCWSKSKPRNLGRDAMQHTLIRTSYNLYGNRA